ncbi:MAG: GPW/gp25 family protein [Saprospirales bacterium]|jgi:phage baseplate assembly protein W|nr:GPW/gp25 family protein [Saprospirales bacterium]MBK6904945.1 GPW/gp25 family protein [Saprospirales bacterium]MBK7337621.1 GPW/gp25 family protein [Saprospirales bacterium]
MKKHNSFLGRGWSFPPTFNKDAGSVEMVAEEEDIRQSLYLLLSTTPGERITNVKFGCDLNRVLFDPVNSGIDIIIKDMITHAILYYEPRISLRDIKIVKDRQLEGVVEISIDYIVRKINARSNIVFPFYQLEGTNVREV